MIDLDHFKNINDTYGHRKGDQALRAVADHIADEVRQGDIFARIGGEEFCLLLPDTDATGARQVADKLCRALNDILLNPADPATQLTASIGVASCTPQPGANWNQLFDSADRRLYLAKSGGRNRVVDSDSPGPG
ncbi:putative diguanylate cyclase YedQ [compost metagenome]